MKKGNKAIIIILCLSFILNVIGINWGFPATWDVDTHVRRVFDMANRGTIIPRRLNYGTALPYFTAVLISPYVFYLNLKGYPLTAENINTTGPEFYNIVFLIARLSNALFAVGIVYLTYLVGKEVFNKKAGLIAALFLAITPGFVVHAHFTTVDVPTIFFMMLVFWFLIKFIKKENPRHLVLAGFTLGIAFSIKYHFAMTMFFPMLLSILFVYKWKVLNKYVIFCGLAFLFGFLLTTPAAILRPADFSKAMYENFGFLVETSETGERGIEGSYGFRKHGNNLGYALSPLLAIISIAIFFAELLIQPSKFNKKSFLLISWAILFYISISLLGFSPVRAVMPLVPIILIIFGEYFIWNPDWVKNAVAVALILTALIQTIQVEMMIVNETRDQATEWIKNNIPDGSTVNIIASDKYLPIIYSKNDLKTIMDRIPYSGVYYTTNTPSYYVEELTPVSDYHYSRINKTEFLGFLDTFKENNRDEYIVITDSYYGRFMDTTFVEGAHSAASFPLITKFYNKLLTEQYGPIVADFKYPYTYPTVPYISPRITIIKVGDTCPSDVTSLVATYKDKSEEGTGYVVYSYYEKD